MRLFWIFLYLHLAVASLTHANFVQADTVNFSVASDEGELSIEQFLGKVVYLDFWASWCAPCRESFPWMNEMQAKYKDQGLVILAVSLDKSKEVSEKFLEDVPADFLIAYDPEGNLANQMKLVGMPTAYVIDRSGKLVESHIGFRNGKRAEYEKSIKSVLNSD